MSKLELRNNLLGLIVHHPQQGYTMVYQGIASNKPLLGMVYGIGFTTL